MRHYTDCDTHDLYARIRMLANEATGFELDDQDYYINQIRGILDELDNRIIDFVAEKE
jgi:hypothetical protein